MLVGQSPYWTGLVGTLLAVGVLTLSFMALAASRDDAISHAYETSANVASVLSSDIARNVELYDLSLQSVIDGVGDKELMGLERSIRQQILFDRATTAKYVSDILALDKNGNIIEDGAPVKRIGNFSDQDFFTTQRDDPAAGLYVSHPYHSSLRNGEMSIALSRRILTPDGSFGGVAFVAVSIDYFRSILSRLDVGPHGEAMIIRVDGTVVARQPDNHDFLGVSIAKGPSFFKMVTELNGAYTARSSLDGIERLYSFEHIPDTSLIAVVAPSLDDVLAKWRSRSIFVGSLTLLASAAFSAVVWLLAFALRERAAAHLYALNLADTDGLTGLSNRRMLDRALAAEWRRMQRSGNSLSLLFVDADNFKIYNDSHGHAMGDLALKAIARCIESATRRPADLAARYGGEEFVVVMPNTTQEGAFAVAETIRREVAMIHLNSPDAPVMPITVSIGCGATLADDAGVGELMARVDRALYVAKESGRNCVAVARKAAKASFRASQA
jgi:diguanylate cyclase (GGDEF)-like protein